jgi:hypothetical protein
MVDLREICAVTKRKSGKFWVLSYGSCPTNSLPLWIVLLWYIHLFKGEIASTMVNFVRHFRHSGPSYILFQNVSSNKAASSRRNAEAVPQIREGIT